MIGIPFLHIFIKYGKNNLCLSYPITNRHELQITNLKELIFYFCTFHKSNGGRRGHLIAHIDHDPLHGIRAGDDKSADAENYFKP